MHHSTLVWFCLALLVPLAAAAAPDADLDGVPDSLDNCQFVPNAGAAGCDTDQDGYGNLCDGDFDQDGDVDGTDFNPPFLADYQFNGVDSGSVGTDMNCDTVVDGADFDPPFWDQFQAGVPGPSGCPGNPGNCAN